MNKYTGNNSKKGTSLLLSISLFIIPPLYIRWQTIRRKENEKEEKRRAQTLAELNKNQSKLWPPLPKIVQSMLSKSRLAYLSTIDADSRSSHLSLMRFTYLRDEEIIVLSTNVNTKKYRMLEKQKGVALLVHDFGSGKVNHSDHEAEDGNYSITLNGECSIVEPGGEAERLRAAHLNHNPDYPQFIVGDNVAILCVRVVYARICNINDHVIKWNLADQKLK